MSCNSQNRVFHPFLKTSLAWVTGLTAGLNTRKYANVCILLFGNSTTVCELQYTALCRVGNYFNSIHSCAKLVVLQIAELSSSSKFFSLARLLAFSNQLGNFISARFKMIEVILLIHTNKIEVKFRLEYIGFWQID